MKKIQMLLVCVMFHEYALGYGLDSWGIMVQVLVETRDFLFSVKSRLSLGPSSLPFSRYWEKSGQGMKLTVLFHIVAK